MSEKPTRDFVVHMRLTPEEVARVDAIADRMVLPRSVMIRSWLMQRVRVEEMKAADSDE